MYVCSDGWCELFLPKHLPATVWARSSADRGQEHGWPDQSTAFGKLRAPAAMHPFDKVAMMEPSDITRIDVVNDV
jgi:hypothetical protein